MHKLDSCFIYHNVILFLTHQSPWSQHSQMFVSPLTNVNDCLLAVVVSG